MAAYAKRVDGEISGWFEEMASFKLAYVSLTPSKISLKRSVFAVHNTITFSTFVFFLKLSMSLQICCTCSSFVPLMTLSARAA
ncbi:hypothetical protein Zmor_023515 [Zophobas morio]|uniref:Uncharacterized protein n=1 Tax=Zophobas morio TaxID=2755281 RepID=A0AA38M7E3_9CUCU|nr:hypothetical protein Zmor_023515 [Zophobas morio]